MIIQRAWGVTLLCILGLFIGVGFLFAVAYPDPLQRIFGGVLVVGCLFVLIGK